VKPGFEESASNKLIEKTISFFDELIQLIHPFMPFISEEIYHLLGERTDDLCVKQFAPIQPAHPELLRKGQLLKEVISALRDARNKAKLNPKEPVELVVQSIQKENYTAGIKAIMAKQVNAKQISFSTGQIAAAITVVCGKDTFYLLTPELINTGSQRDDMQKELEYLRGFLVSVNKKLSNERFVQNAKPEVVSLELKKKEDAETKIKVLEGSLANLS
jgi:valyl-tRNA synthetase